MGYMVTVNCQVNKFSTAYVDERIEEFLIHSEKLLAETTEEDLEQIKEDLIKTKEVADVHLQEEVGRNWEEIVTDDYMFDRNQQEIEAIRALSITEVRDWWNRQNRYGNKENFRKISIQVIKNFFVLLGSNKVSSRIVFQVVGHGSEGVEKMEDESGNQFLVPFCEISNI